MQCPSFVRDVVEPVDSDVVYDSVALAEAGCRHTLGFHDTVHKYSLNFQKLSERKCGFVCVSIRFGCEYTYIFYLQSDVTKPLQSRGCRVGGGDS